MPVLSLFVSFLICVLISSAVSFVAWNVVIILRQAAAEMPFGPTPVRSFVRRLPRHIAARWTGSSDPILRPGPGQPRPSSFWGRFRLELAHCAIRSRLSWVRMTPTHRLVLFFSVAMIAPLFWVGIAARKAAR